MLKIPFFNIINNSIFMFIKYEYGYISHLLFISFTILFPPIINSFPLVFLKHLFVNLIFKFILIFK